jgi:hypothetical protein
MPTRTPGGTRYNQRFFAWSAELGSSTHCQVNTIIYALQARMLLNGFSLAGFISIL